ARPHHVYETEFENRRPQMGVPASSSVVRQIAKRGPRSGQLSVADEAIPLPQQLVIDRHRPTTDTDANRFVRFALEHWRRTGEAAATVVWEGSEDVFAAGQRDVAALYEFWVYLQLRRILASFCDEGLDELPLFVLDRDRLVLDLRRGRSRVLRGRSSRLGRT